MKPDIVEFVTDPQLLGLSLSPAQETLLRSIYGLALNTEQLELWRRCTGRSEYQCNPFSDVAVIAGARSGKDSRIAAPILLFEALCGEHTAARGEALTIPCVAQDMRAARIAFGYVRDYLQGSPILSREVDEVLASEVRLSNGVTVATFPCTLRSLRGWSIPAAVMDEYGFFRAEGEENADAEILTSLRRGGLAFPHPRLVRITTPYLKAGLAYDDFKRAFGQDDPDTLCWVAPSILMNPSLSEERLEQERRLDPSRFSREYEAVWQDDLSAFLPGAWIEAAIVSGRRELPPLDGVTYTAAVDSSGGAGKDAFTLAVVHAEGKGAERRIVQDVMKAWRGDRQGLVDLEGIVAEAAATLKPYRVRRVFGDRYARHWVGQAFERHGVKYADPEISGTYADRSRAYLAVESLFAQGRIAILDHPALARELFSLERRLHTGGRVAVDHPPGGHDDHSNALALAAAFASQQRTGDHGVSIGRITPTLVPVQREGEPLNFEDLSAAKFDRVLVDPLWRDPSNWR